MSVRLLLGRVTATPLRPFAETFENLRVGSPTGPSTYRKASIVCAEETGYGTEEFFEPVYVKGRRTRVGAEINYTPGPVGLTGEWMQAREERLDQGIRRTICRSLTTGWYISANMAGDRRRQGRLQQSAPFAVCRRRRGVEVGARYERLGFESVG